MEGYQLPDKMIKDLIKIKNFQNDADFEYFATIEDMIEDDHCFYLVYDI